MPRSVLTLTLRSSDTEMLAQLADAYGVEPSRVVTRLIRRAFAERARKLGRAAPETRAPSAAAKKKVAKKKVAKKKVAKKRVSFIKPVARPPRPEPRQPTKKKVAIKVAKKVAKTRALKKR